jgi:hypothetical protein
MSETRAYFQNWQEQENQRSIKQQHLDCAGRAAAATALSDYLRRSVVNARPESGVALRLPPQSKIFSSPSPL